MKRLKLNCSKMKQDETSHIFDELMEFLRNLLIGVAVGGISLVLILVWWIYG